MSKAIGTPVILFLVLTAIIACDKKNTDDVVEITLPTVATTEITEIQIASALSRGEIIDDGNSPIIEKGVCWSTSPLPTLADSFTEEGPGNESFISNITGLEQNTTYYVRAYASNAEGTAYGPEINFMTFKVYEGDVTLSSQEEVDDFGNGAYYEINGNFKLENNPDDSEANITDLTPLNSIVIISGALTFSYLENLSGINGFNNLSHIGMDLTIVSSHSRSGPLHVDGLAKLQDIGGNLVLNGSNLTNLDGFSSLKEIKGNAEFFFNYNLISIEGLQNLEIIEGVDGIRMLNNINLENLNGLEKLTSIEALELTENGIKEIDGLTGLETILGWLYINNNPFLENLNGLVNLTVLGADSSAPIPLGIHYNASLVDFCGLQTLFNNGFGYEDGIDLHDNGFDPSFGEEGNCAE